MEKYNPLAEDKKENINLFCDIIDPKKLSKYSSQLNKIFSSYSYSTFYNNLTKIKEEKKPITLKDKINEWLYLSNFTNKFPEHFNMDKFKSKLKEMELQEILSLEKRKKYKNNNMIKRKLISQFTKNKVSKIKDKYKLLQNPCIGVYNPKYESIGKHTYQVSFGKQNLSDYNNKDRNHNNIDNKNNSFNLKSKTLYSYREKNYNLKKFEKDLNKAHTQIKFNRINKLKFKNKNTDENNLFNKTNYNNNETNETNETIIHNSSRRIKRIMNHKNKINNNEKILFFPKLKRNKRNKSNNENIILYLNTSTLKNSLTKNRTINHNLINKRSMSIRENNKNNNVKGIIKFDKISSNRKIGGYFEEIAKKNQSPPVGIYYPSYSSIFRRTTNVFISNKKNKNKKFKNIKKNLLNKIITNYNQNKEFELFHSLNKANKDKNDKD